MKLPKTFLAINLSDAFSFEDEKCGEGEAAESAEATEAADGEVLEMKTLSHADDATPMAVDTETATADDQATE